MSLVVPDAAVKRVARGQAVHAYLLPRLTVPAGAFFAVRVRVVPSAERLGTATMYGNR